MKVYIVVKYVEDKCDIVNIFNSREAADKHAERCESRNRLTDIETYHVLCKPVKGLSDIKFEEENGKRYVTFKQNKRIKK